MLRTIRDRFRAGNSVNVLGVRVDPTNMDLAVETVITWARSTDRGCRYVCVRDVHGVVEAQSDERFRSILNNADLNVPDGTPLTWLGWFAGFREMGRVYGPDFMVRVCEASVEHKIAHFFYGGKDGVAAELAGRFEQRFPGLRVAGTHCPPFRSLTEEEQESIVNMINASGAHILWVGLSTPKQERLMSDLHRRLHAHVAFGVGAAFDYNTDRLRRAPRWVQRAGLEWLYRLLQEPRRLISRYGIAIPRFLRGLVLQALGKRFECDRGH